MKSIATLTIFVAAAAALSGPGRVYEPQGALGACGVAIEDTDFVASLEPSVFGDGSHCGEQIVVTGSNGNTVNVTVQDSCEACRDNGLELTPSAFVLLEPLNEEEIEVTYTL
ncbi:hypothetical protein DFH06DRAFT_1141092 [Mycena polygramma]|nr:hypothetical protein DFH06DRAFT_1141092 [Mycena polygramma]